MHVEVAVMSCIALHKVASVIFYMFVNYFMWLLNIVVELS